MPEEAEKPDRNRHIRDYLAQFRAFPHSPHFAVMIKGPWGIGKTYLIKRLLERDRQDEKPGYVYVSLYGIESLDEIDQAILRAIYPLLNSKITKVAGRVAKTAMKYFKLDPELALPDLLSKFGQPLYVFDDLERCGVSIHSVLGYINEFVEHDGAKVILIANEDELTPDNDYARRREKLIGRTFTVQSALESALEHFLTLVDDAKARDFLQQNADVIGGVYHQSGLNNLRLLQQTIWDFERLYNVLGSEHLKNKHGMRILLSMFFALGMEFKSGRIDSGDFRNRLERAVSAQIGGGDGGGTVGKLAAASKRYPDFKLYDTILSDDVLISVFQNGLVDEKAVRSCLDASGRFVKPSREPAWRTVWHWMERPDDAVEKSIKKMEAEFAGRKIVELGALLHIFGLRLHLSDKKLINASREQIVTEGKQYIDDLYGRAKLSMPEELNDDLRSSGYGGLGIYENQTPEYKALYDYLNKQRQRGFTDTLPKKASELLKEMRKDPALYFRRLCYSNSDDSIYLRVPILAFLPAVDFVDALLALKTSSLNTVLTVFKERYEHGALANELAQEKAWLEEVRQVLIGEIAQMRPVARCRFQNCVDWYISPYL